MGTEVKVEEESGQISELEQKVIRQIEYYFGNFNLSKDKFLRDQLKLDEGWVPLETMIKFKRLQSLTDDFDVICAALKKSPNELMEVDEEAKKIRRRVEKPLPADDSANRDALDERTLYVKGFKKTSTLDELLEFFKGHKAENVAMRRNKLHKNKPFKGSCFVLFETKEDLEKFLANNEIKYENTELLKERRKDYTKRKDIYYQNIRAEREKKASNKKSANEGNDGESKGDESKDNDTKEIEMTPGCLVRINGLGKNCSREDIKPVFEKFGTVVFVDYFRGNPEAVVRFETPVAAKVLEEATEEDGEKKIEIASSMATISAVEGDSEKEYWKNIAISKANARKFSHNQRSNKGRFNKNNKNWGRKRNHRDGDNDERPSKKQKNDSSDNGQKDVANEKSNGAKNVEIQVEA